VSQAPVPQRDRPSPPGQPAGGPGARAAGDGTSGNGWWPRAAIRYLPVAVPAAVMIALGLWGLARHSDMGNDEVATRWAALLGVRQLVHLLAHVDAVHGLYYLLMHGWMAVGTSPAAMRVPSVAAITVAVAVTAVIARRLTGSAWAGVLAGLVMALTPVISFYAQTARSYAFVIACVAGTTLALLHAMSAEQASEPGGRMPRQWLLYGGLVTLGGYLNEMSLLVLAAHAVTVVLARYGRQAVKHWLTAGAAGAVLVVPLLALSVHQAGAVSWIQRPGLADMKILFHDYFGATLVVPVLLVVCAVIALLPEAGQQPPWWRAGGLTLPSVAAPLLVVPAGILICESLVAPPLYVDRYVLYGEVGAALLAGAGLWRAGRWLAAVGRWRTLRWVPGIAVCVCVLVLQLGAQHRARTPQSRLFNFGGPAHFVGAHARPGDGVLFSSNLFRKDRLGYPYDFRGVTDFAMAVPPERAGNFRGRDKPFSQIQPLMAGYQRIWVIGKMPSASLPPGTFQQESGVLLRQYSLVQQRQFKGITVTLWARR
jgi:mannosyltransferase